MRRLTQKDGKGNWGLKGVPWGSLREGMAITKEIQQALYGALYKLKDYEDTGLSPDEVESLNEFENNNAQKYLMELAKHKWIPVEERLPEVDERSGYYEGNKYMKRLEIAYKTDTVEYVHGYYDGYKWMDKWYDIIKNVVAWKIHEPYRPERSEE